MFAEDGHLCPAKIVLVAQLCRPLISGRLEKYLLILWKQSQNISQRRGADLFPETFSFHFRSLQELKPAEILTCSDSGYRLWSNQAKMSGGCKEWGQLQVEFDSTSHLHIFLVLSLAFLICLSQAELHKEKNPSASSIFFFFCKCCFQTDWFLHLAQQAIAVTMLTQQK